MHNEANHLKWIVLEDNPKPDDYVAIMIQHKDEQPTLDEGKTYSVFSERHSAISRALEIKDLFRVRKIRIFYPDGHSEGIRKSKK